MCVEHEARGVSFVSLFPSGWKQFVQLQHWWGGRDCHRRCPAPRAVTEDAKVSGGGSVFGWRKACLMACSVCYNGCAVEAARSMVTQCRCWYCCCRCSALAYDGSLSSNGVGGTGAAAIGGALRHVPSLATLEYVVWARVLWARGLASLLGWCVAVVVRLTNLRRA